VGFGYADWSRVFYPPDLKPADYLAYYARYFDAVELDTTFHAAPTEPRVRRWADATPDDFRFCVKTPRDVTHADTLEKGAAAMPPFLDACRAFGAKLGVVLLQFPPSFGRARVGALDALLAALPRDLRFAVEFRHRSWDVEETAELLRRYGVAMVWADYMEEPWALRATADFLYVRWIGVHDRFPAHEREGLDVSDRLAWWQGQIAEAKTPGPPPAAPATVWGFFNNDYSGYAVGTLARMRTVLGLPSNLPRPEDRGMLFG
jgi:uncharacterized protein YecE (DUF72 family)